MTIELTRQEAEEVVKILRMMYTNHALTKAIAERLAGEPLIEFPKEPEPEEVVDAIWKVVDAEWKDLSTAEIKAIWNLTKKPSEFSTMLLAKIKEKNDLSR
jgi:hypothetical protein